MTRDELRALVDERRAAFDLGPRLRRERERSGISLRAAADETGISFNSLSRIERGRDCLYSHALTILAWLDTAEPRSCPSCQGGGTVLVGVGVVDGDGNQHTEESACPNCVAGTAEAAHRANQTKGASS